MNSNRSRRPFRFVAIVILFALVMGFACQPQVNATPNAAPDLSPSQQGTAPPASSDPIQTATSGRIQLREFAFDPLAADLAAQGATEAAVNSANLGLFLVQFTKTPDDAMLNALTPGATYVQYVPTNAFIVWTTPAALQAAKSNDFVRWTGSFYPELRTSLEVREAAAAADPALVTVEATFIADGSLDRLENLIVANGGAIDYREPAPVMSESLAAERWRFSISGSALAQVARWPSLIALERFEVPRIAESRTNSFLATADTTPYLPWLADVGVNGSGVMVAILDTGVDWDHPDLQNVTSGQETGGYAEHFRADGTTPQEQPGSDGGPLIGGNGSGHGTHVAGSVAGTGVQAIVGQDPLIRFGQGTAPGATLHAVDYLADDSTHPPQANMHTVALASGAALSSNSYGGGISQGYTGTSANQDEVSLDVNPADTLRQPMLMVFAAANAGFGATGLGTACAAGWPDQAYPCDRSMATHAEAKNVITVGASGSPHSTPTKPYNPGLVGNWFNWLNTIANFSSRGPAIDGRVKPDVVAAGHGIISTENHFVEAGGHTEHSCNDNTGLSELHSWCQGTSMATPAVSGIAALFTQYWREDILPDNVLRDPLLANPEPATVKAAFIVSADRIGNRLGADDGFGNGLFRTWPNGYEGWGRVNGDRMLDPPVPVLYFENPQVLTDQGDTWSILVRRADPLEPMKVVLVWSDAPGAAGANPALVNNLDLLVSKPGTNDDYCGNFFEPNNMFFSEDCGDGSHSDNLNNVEYVILPAQGVYGIRVTAAALLGNGVREFGDNTDQHFSLVCYNCIQHYYVKNREVTNLVAYWKFDEGQGQTVLNSIHGPGSLTLGSGSFATDTPAPLGFTSYGYLTGVGSASPVATAADHSGRNPQGELSIAMWVRPTQRPAGTIMTLLGHGNTQLSINAGGKLVMMVNNNLIVSTVAIPNDTWTHVAGTWSKDGYIRVYINGVERGIAFTDGTPPGTSDAALTIGSNLYGAIDDVRFYSKRLNDYEAERLAAGRECETTGASWSDPFQFIGCGLTAAAAAGGGEVRVAEGTYWPGTNRAASFVIPFGVTLVGGFEGIDPAARDRLAYPTILSGDLDRNDGAGVAGLTGRNSYHVVQLGSIGVLDGFIVEHGLADGSGEFQAGGAGILSLADGSRTLRRLIVRDNHAITDGGGLYAFGGGDLLMEQTEFIGNKADSFGGGAMIFSPSAVVRNTIFSGNRAFAAGGLFFGGPTSLVLSNATLFGNTADFFGGLRVQGDAAVDVTNSLLYGNNAPADAQLSISETATPVNVSNNIIEGGFAGSGNFSTPPLLADPDGEDNTPGTIDDNLHPTRSSPAVDTGVGCVGADFVGTPRNVDGDLDGTGGCDRGAYEFGTVLVVTEYDGVLDERVFYITSLQAQGIAYELWDAKFGTLKPGAARLSGHPRVLWTTGTNSSNVGPTGDSETAVANWLDGGNRCLMLTGFYYLNGQGPTPSTFVQNYLGVSSFELDKDYRVSRGAGLFADKVYHLTGNLPKAWLSFNDRVEPNTAAGAIPAFIYENFVGGTQGVSLTTAAFRTAFLGFPLSAVSANRDSAVSDRGGLLNAFFNNCEGIIPPGSGALTLSVQPNPLTYSAAGDQITYSYTILNSGTKKLNGPFSVVDNRVGTVDPCGSGPLNPGQTTSCTATYTVTQGDVGAGSISNVAHATGNAVTSPDSGSTVTAATGTLVLKVSANPQTYSRVGDAITYTYLIRNEGNATINGPFAITDGTVGNIPSCGSGPLSVGGETSCTAVYTITQNDLDNGSVTTIATASGGGKTSAPSSVTVTAASGDLTLTLTANKTAYSVLGEEIVYTYVIKNTGAGTLDGPFAVNDNRLGAIAPCGNGPLAPQEQTSCTAPYTITAADLETSSITNVATVSGNGKSSQPASVTLSQELARLLLRFFPSKQYYSAVGEQIINTYQIDNVGDLTLAGPFTVVDDRLGTIEPCGSGPLAPAAATICTATITVTQADIDAGSINYYARASGNGYSSQPALQFLYYSPTTVGYRINLPAVLKN